MDRLMTPGPARTHRSSSAAPPCDAAPFPPQTGQTASRTLPGLSFCSLQEGEKSVSSHKAAVPFHLIHTSKKKKKTAHSIREVQIPPLQKT